MNPAPPSGERRLSAAELRSLFQQFADVVSTDKRISAQMTVWSEARGRWRSQWSGRNGAPSDVTFPLLAFNQAPAGQDWVHPFADQAPELNSWRTLWDAATGGERNDLAAAFERAIAQIETDPASAGEACAQLSRSAAPRGCPLAALTPALSALDPVRFVAVCDAWLRVLGQHEGAPVSHDLAAYPEVNTIAFRWLAAAEGDGPAPVLAGCPPADRFGLFCSWVVRTTSDAANAARTFDVTRKKYKEWPPMW